MKEYLQRMWYELQAIPSVIWDRLFLGMWILIMLGTIFSGGYIGE